MHKDHNCEETKAMIVPSCQVQELARMEVEVDRLIKSKSKRRDDIIVEFLVSLKDKLHNLSFDELGDANTLTYVRVKKERLIMLRIESEHLIYKAYLEGYLDSSNSVDPRTGMPITFILVARALGFSDRVSNTSIKSMKEIMQQMLFLIGQEDPGNELEVKGRPPWMEQE